MGNPRIVLGTLINEELSLLNAQVSILQEFVSAFYVAEATETFQRRPKSLVLRDSRYQLPRSVVPVEVDIDDDWRTGDAWHREHRTRHDLWRRISQSEPEGTIVLFVDVDEFVDPDRLWEISARTDEFGVVGLEMTCSYFYLEGLTPEPWSLGRAIKVGKGSQIDSTLRTATPRHLVKGSGIHLSYHVSQPIQHKLRSFSHTELSIESPTDQSFYDLCIRFGVDPFGRFLLSESRAETSLARLIATNLPSASAPVPWLSGVNPEVREAVRCWASLRVRPSLAAGVPALDALTVDSLTRDPAQPPEFAVLFAAYEKSFATANEAEELRALKASRSWRMTKPCRDAVRVAHRVKAGLARVVCTSKMLP